MRLPRVAPRDNGPVAPAAGPCLGGGVADQAQESPQSRLLAAGFGRRLEWWLRLTAPRCWVWRQFADEMLTPLTLSDEQAAANER